MVECSKLSFFLSRLSSIMIPSLHKSLIDSDVNVDFDVDIELVSESLEKEPRTLLGLGLFGIPSSLSIGLHTHSIFERKMQSGCKNSTTRVEDLY